MTRRGEQDTARLRPGRRTDAPALHRLIAAHVGPGRLLPRGLDDVGRHAGRFVVGTVRGRIVGCGELAPLARSVAEVRSLVVAAPWRGRGLGRRMIEALLERAADAGLDRVCAFTHDQAPFARFGFVAVPHDRVPEKIATDCRQCALFGACSQVALVVNPVNALVARRPAYGIGDPAGADRPTAPPAAGS